MHARLLCLCLLIAASHARQAIDCAAGSLSLLETMPSDLVQSVGAPHLASHAEQWLRLAQSARSSIAVSALWADLTSGAAALGGNYGRALASALEKSRVASVTTNDCRVPHWPFTCNETQSWVASGTVDVVYVNQDDVLSSSPRSPTDAWGCIHSKIMVVDNHTACVGSANLAWTSLAQTREVSLLIAQCPELAAEAAKQVARYSLAAHNGNRAPLVWPAPLYDAFSRDAPALVTINGTQTYSMYLTTAPDVYMTPTSTADLTSFVQLIGNATSSISIELMDFTASQMYQAFRGVKNKYWPVLSDALTAAAFRGVKVRLMVSKWFRTKPLELQFWHALNQIENIEVKQWVMPAYAGGKVGSRVNHAKFMIIDNTAIVSTSNWAEEYFETFAGASWVVSVPSGVNPLRDQLLAVYNRDWQSPYVSSV